MKPMGFSKTSWNLLEPLAVWVNRLRLIHSVGYDCQNTTGEHVCPPSKDNNKATRIKIILRATWTRVRKMIIQNYDNIRGLVPYCDPWGMQIKQCMGLLAYHSQRSQRCRVIRGGQWDWSLRLQQWSISQITQSTASTSAQGSLISVQTFSETSLSYW